jgi:pilin isopeptide linkage protein/LPXTG-motif cell wall-anchored protein
VVLEGSKNLTGRELADGEFEFEVRDDKGNLVTTGTNKADGTIVFQQMVIGSELELVLNVSEVKGTDKQIEYDDYIYRVKLTVTNDNGVLKADVQYLDGDIVFYNEYEVPETPPTGDDTPLFLYMGLMFTSAAALMAMLVLGRKKKENN